MSWPGGVRRVLLAEVDSTNAHALREAAGLDGPTWFMARRQTAGRGRSGRIWHDPVGNFAATLALPLSEPPARLALRSFVAALALDQALQAVGVPAADLEMKWPNDVLLRGRKLAGILLETVSTGSGATLAIGIGVNLSHAPEQTGLAPAAMRSISLAETGCEATQEAFLDALAPAFADHEAEFQARGFVPLRRAWLARAARLGEQITARTPREEIRGRFDTVDESGHLVLGTETGARRIAAADVFFSSEEASDAALH